MNQEMNPEDMKGIPTGDGAWLKRVCKELGNQHDPAPPAMNPWYQSAVREIERLEAAVQTLMNQNNTLNDGIKVLKDQAVDFAREVNDLKANRDHYRELLQLAGDRERRLLNKLDTVKDFIRLSYKTVRQD
jgi:hypothetical protein